LEFNTIKEVEEEKHTSHPMGANRYDQGVSFSSNSCCCWGLEKEEF
jgi:hypothetical protein